jgi:transketolase
VAPAATAPARWSSPGRRPRPQPRDADTLAAVARGGYVLRPKRRTAGRAMIIATGSEVELAMAAAAELADQGVEVRVVSMPSTDAF